MTVSSPFHRSNIKKKTCFKNYFNCEKIAAKIEGFE